MVEHLIVSEALPTPECHDGLGENCPGPFELTLSSCRPGETDGRLHCRECGAARHFVFDTAGSVVHDSGASELSTLHEYRHRDDPPEAPPEAAASPVAPALVAGVTPLRATSEE